MEASGEEGSDSQDVPVEIDDGLEAARKFVTIRQRAVSSARTGGLLMLLGFVALLLPVGPVELRILVFLVFLVAGVGVVLLGIVGCRCPACGFSFGVSLPVWSIDRLDHCPSCGVNLSLH